VPLAVGSCFGLSGPIEYWVADEFYLDIILFV